jgi:hypothetical protein
MPFDAPVTTATLPLRSLMIDSCTFSAFRHFDAPQM